MIAAWMLYALLVGVLAGTVALVAEKLLRAHRLPTRWVWAGSMGLTLLWPFGQVLWESWPRKVAPLPLPDPGRIAVLDPLAVHVTQESILRVLDGPILAAWLVSTSVLVTFFALLIIRTRRLRRGWSGEDAGGHRVFFSRDLGPAVVGYMRPEIVLPAWCRDLEDQTLGMIIDHEMEHVKAGDLRLMLTAGMLPVLFPWHLPLWWQFKRLRTAAEGDCDLRVVRKYPEQTRSYMELLLQVGGRAPRAAALVAMLSEAEETLARRIRIMTMPFPKKPWLRGAFLAALGAILLAVACWAPSPSEAPEDTPDAVVIEVPPEVEISPVAGLAQGRRSSAVATSPEEATEAETPWEALKHFFEVTARSVRDWIDGLLGREGAEEAGISAAPTFTPFTVRPDIKNRDEVARVLEREYPPLVRDAGIGGTVNVWFFIDETGRVRKVQVNESSGHKALDEAALRVAAAIEFTPALNRGTAVPVWISLPITFSVADRRGEAPKAQTDLSSAPTFTPFTVRPDIKNRDEVARAMEQEYPPLLRDAGIGGTINVWFFIGENGVVQRTLVNESSGHKALDEAAIRVADIIQFTPALNRDTPVPVWISLPITFTSR
ncbi:MAG: TonB family protein [Gemmatimonadota bacterium]